MTVELSALGHEATVSDWQGRRRGTPVTNGRLAISLTTWPRYVRGVQLPATQ